MRLHGVCGCILVFFPPLLIPATAEADRVNYVLI